MKYNAAWKCSQKTIPYILRNVSLRKIMCSDARREWVLWSDTAEGFTGLLIGTKAEMHPYFSTPYIPWRESHTIIPQKWTSCYCHRYVCITLDWVKEIWIFSVIKPSILRCIHLELNNQDGMRTGPPFPQYNMHSLKKCMLAVFRLCYKLVHSMHYILQIRILHAHIILKKWN